MLSSKLAELRGCSEAETRSKSLAVSKGFDKRSKTSEAQGGPRLCLNKDREPISMCLLSLGRRFERSPEKPSPVFRPHHGHRCSFGFIIFFIACSILNYFSCSFVVCYGSVTVTTAPDKAIFLRNAVSESFAGRPFGACAQLYRSERIDETPCRTNTSSKLPSHCFTSGAGDVAVRLHRQVKHQKSSRRSIDLQARVRAHRCEQKLGYSTPAETSWVISITEIERESNPCCSPSKRVSMHSAWSCLTPKFQDRCPPIHGSIYTAED